MKKFTLVLLAVLAISTGNKAFAQGKYGADSAECVKYLSYYGEHFKNYNNYLKSKDSKSANEAFELALPRWREAYRLCPPTASQNLFIHGSTIYSRLISQNASNKEYVQQLADTLIALQKTRIEYYPATKLTVLNNLGQYIINYKSGNQEYVYTELNDIVSKLGENAKPGLLVNNLQAGIQLYKDGKISADDVISVYERNISFADAMPVKTEDEATAKAQAQVTLQSVFADSKVASCENLINIFGPRLDADPDNVALATTIAKLMNNAEDCFNNDLYLRAVTSMHANDPSHNSAYFLYKLHNARGNGEDAVKYLEEAISSGGADDAQKAAYSYELANISLKSNNKSKAYSAALEAARLDPSWTGKSYFLIGTIWASTSCGGDDISRRAPYWVAVDYFQKAKNADPSLADDANRMIGQYSAYYPEAAEAFMYDLTAGQSYTVSCSGMTATTTVKVSK